MIQGCHENTTEGGAVVQWVEGSPSLCEAPSLLHLQLLQINRMVAGTPVILESGFGGKKIRSHLQLHTAFGASLSYMSLSQNPKENTWLTENSVHIPEVDLG